MVGIGGAGWCCGLWMVGMVLDGSSKVWMVGVGWWRWCWMIVETSKVWQLWLVDGWRMQAELHKPTFTN